MNQGWVMNSIEAKNIATHYGKKKLLTISHAYQIIGFWLLAWMYSSITTLMLMIALINQR